MTPTNQDVIKALKILTDMRKQTTLWNRHHSHDAGIIATHAWQIRGDFWLVEFDQVLILFVGAVKVGMGRAEVLKTVTERMF